MFHKHFPELKKGHVHVYYWYFAYVLLWGDLESF